MSSDPDFHLREALVEHRVIHRGRLVELDDDTVRLADGTVTHREVVRHPGAVTVVAIDERARVALVRQWRHAAGRALWELPAGTCDHAGEELGATAGRELEEEAGVIAGRWRALGHAPLAPGYSTEELHFFAASELRPGTPQADADERLDVGWFTREDVRGLVRDGAVDVKTMAGLALCGWTLGDG